MQATYLQIFESRAIFFSYMSQRIQYRTVSPDTYQALLGLQQHLSKVVDPKLRALVELRVSQINGCAFCLDMHSHEARQLGETQQRLDCVAGWRDAPFYTDRERAALAWAESLALVAATRAPDEVYAEAKKYFTEKELVDLTADIGMINLWNRLCIGLSAEPKERPAA
jgi:AhpD family alkylhydroperoxidase